MESEASYIDASVVLRSLYRLPGAALFSDRAMLLTSSELVRVEVALSIDRRRLAGDLDAAEAETLRKDGDRLLASLHLFPVSDEVIRFATEPFPIAVPLMSELHVATAQLVRGEVSRVIFWTHRQPQAAAAVARGLEVESTALAT